ncbi:MAG: TonB-dependent receptor, partial [Alphaproteobacteria bacterium]|nr:TonB-dependent receptor [Alphaproteobacteria bacterium]
MKFTLARFALGVSMIAMAVPALAQSTDTKQSADAEPEIVVTGSLIRRPNNTSVSPIVAVSSEALQQSGQPTLESALNELPGFTPAGSAGTGGQGTGGHVTINLHGLGTNRNLVLLDGKRMPLADIAGDVDINFIPESIVGNVEAITGGASAVYGSDAMSGVVNFKTIPWLDGVVLDGQAGISAKGDYKQADLSATWGSKFAQGRGHILVAVSYANRGGLSGADRPDFFAHQVPSGYLGQGTFVPSANNLPTQAAYNSVFGSYGFAPGAVKNTINLGFNDNGSLFAQTGAQNYQGPTTGYWAILGGNVRMPVGLQTQLLNPLNRTTIFTKADYEVAPGVTAYGQFMYVDDKVNTASGSSLTQLNNLTTIPVTNPFIPAALQTILASRPNPTANFLWNGRYWELPYKNWDEKYYSYQFLGGLKGDLGHGWNWDAYAGYDQTKHDQYMNNAVLKSRVQSLLSAPDGGNSICAGGFDPFGLANAESLSSACKSYMTTTELNQETMTQFQSQALLDGPLFKLPGGDAHLAVLAAYRRNTYRFDPSADLAAGNIEAVIASSPVAEHAIGVKEVAAQVDLPLLKDVPFAQELGIGGAIRYSDYTTSGGTTTYEGDARWRPVRSLLFRGSYQRAVRAPNIGELYSPLAGEQVVIGTPPTSIGDPCDVRSTARTGANGAQVASLCQALGVPAAVAGTYQFQTTATGGFIQGNTALTPEKANTYNIGAVWSPKVSNPFFRDFNLSVDYYNINISNVISKLAGLTTLSKCFNLDGSNPSYAATNYYCSLIQRDANGQLVGIAEPYLNQGGLKTDGIEIQVNWGWRVHNAAHGRIYLSSDIGYTAHYMVQTL